MVIKHIVICGGGPTGLFSYGAAKYLAQQGFWRHADIETIYGTSIGALVGAMLCLKHEWTTLDDYIIKRPWEKVIVESLEMFELFSCKGMAKLKLLDDIMQPLLESKDLSLATTLAEFYTYSGISLNVFTVELNTFQQVQLSHATHPDLPLMDAIKMSACMPMLFQPIIRDKCCYIDGGIISNYPLQECMQDTRCRDDEVLGLLNQDPNESISEQSSFMDYMRFITLQLVRRINRNRTPEDNARRNHPHEVVCHVKPGVTQAEWFSIMSDADQRLAWIEDGIAFGKEFLSTMDATKATNAMKAMKATKDADAADPDAAATTPTAANANHVHSPKTNSFCTDE
jgi:predicted acylesterase/phospholipase RssA